jgi:hypothetical protein
MYISPRLLFLKHLMSQTNQAGELSISAQRRAKRSAKRKTRSQTIAIIQNAFGVSEHCASYLMDRALYHKRNNLLWSAGLQNAIIQLDRVREFNWASLKPENENETFSSYNIEFSNESIKSFVDSEQEGWTIVRNKHSKKNFAGIGLYAPF